MKTPTEKQIDLVKDICKVLNIEFPISSLEYNSYTYFHFIKNNLNKYLEEKQEEFYDRRNFSIMDEIMEDAFLSSYDFY